MTPLVVYEGRRSKEEERKKYMSLRTFWSFQHLIGVQIIGGQKEMAFGQSFILGNG